jgi:two-component system response regulator MprA
VLAYGDLVLEVSTRSAQRGDRHLALSAREAALLELLLRNSRQVVSRELALERVWGGVTAASPNVVDRYVYYLRRKLGEPPLIQAVRGTGFILGR